MLPRGMEDAVQKPTQDMAALKFYGKKQLGRMSGKAPLGAQGKEDSQALLPCGVGVSRRFPRRPETPTNAGWCASGPAVTNLPGLLDHQLATAALAQAWEPLRSDTTRNSLLHLLLVSRDEAA